MSRTGLEGSVKLFCMSFARKLQELRKERDLTQDEVARAIGVHKRHVSTWENGRSKPSYDSLVGLSKLFGISVDYLLFENVPREGFAAINDFELYEHFRKTEDLPNEAKQAVKELVDAVVLKYKINQMPEAKPFSDSGKTTSTPLSKVAGKR